MTTELRKGKNLKLLIVASTRVKKGKVWGVFLPVFRFISGYAQCMPGFSVMLCGQVWWLKSSHRYLRVPAGDRFLQGKSSLRRFRWSRQHGERDWAKKRSAAAPQTPYITVVYTELGTRYTLPASSIRSVRTNSRCGEAESVRLKIATGRSFLCC